MVADVLRAARRPLAGFLDDSSCRGRVSPLGLPVLDARQWMSRIEAYDEIGVALGIGGNRARQEVSDLCRRCGFEIVNAVRPSAALSPAARIGAGTVVLPLAVVNPDARLGAGVIINTSAVVEHDCVVGDYAHISRECRFGRRCTRRFLFSAWFGSCSSSGSHYRLTKHRRRGCSGRPRYSGRGRGHGRARARLE
jgi:hypothetical protein